MVHLTNAAGCDSAATLNLTVNPLPTTPSITASGATTFCAGGSVILTSDAATTYSWTGGATTQAITVTTGGTYTVTVSDGNCTATSAPITVVVNSLPVVSGIIQPGQFGNGLNFDGSTDYVSVPSSSSLNISSAITLEAWIYPTKKTGGIQNVMSKSSASANNSYIFPRTDNSWTSFVVYLNIGGWKTLSFPYPTTGTWHHLAATYDGSTIKLYLDGTMVTSMAASGSISTNSNILSLGNQPGYNEFYGGFADELRIWNVARTQAQIQASMNVELVGNESGLVAYYNLNQGVAGGNNTAITSVLDKTANANNGSFNTFALNGATSNFVAGATNSGSIAAGNVCVGGTIQLSNATTGGVWSSSNTAVATVSNAGVVTGIANGTAIINYTVTNASGCTATVTTNITVNDNPVVPAITGNTSVCAGSTTTLANTITGGVWSSAATGIATVNANGVVTGVSNGTVAISYIVTNAGGCSTTVTANVTVNALPTVNNISQSGELGNGLALNSAAANYVSVSSNTNIPVTTGAYTIESYIKPTTHAVNGIVGWGNWGSYNQVNALRLGSGNQVINYWWGNDLVVTLPNSLVDGLWHHIAATFDGTTRKIYVDGVLKGQDNPTGHAVTLTSNLRIGTTNNAEYFNGSMDEVRIWNVARTQAQIQASMTSELAGTESGLVAYYNFNQGVAGGNNAGITTLLDKTSNANNGTLQNISLNGSSSNFVSGANSTGISNNVCIGSTVTYTNATTGGVWSSLNTGIATVDASGVVTGVTAGATSINYTVTNSFGCITTVTKSITVNALPVATISASGSTTLCLGSSVTLTASLGSAYAWSNGATTRSITVNTAGNYNVAVTNANGCTTTSANTTVIVNNPSSSTTVVKVPFGSTYLFNGVTYTATGIYVAHLTNAVGCDSTATLDFTVDPKPSAGADQVVACGSGSNTTTVTLTGTLPTTGVWSSMAGNDAGAILGTNTNGVVVVTLPAPPFTGKLSYIYTTFGGKDTVDIYVTGPASPVININAGSPIICAGSTVQLCPQTWGFSNYQWYKDGYPLTGTAGTSSCITVDATGIGSYTLAGTNGSGCWSLPSAPQVVSTTNSLTKPTISLSGSSILCNGGSVTLTSSSATDNLWFKNGNSTGAITQSITVSEPGDYSVLVTTGTCTSAMSLTTTISGGVKASFTIANASNSCDSTISFTSTSANTTSTWNFGDGTTGIGNTVTHKYASTGLFTVKQAVISVGGCKDTAVQTITVASCPPPPPPTTCNITPGFKVINNTVNGGSYTYISTSTITNGNMTYFWDLGNGTTSTLISPSVTYAVAGTYQVKLVVTGDLGCKDSITQSVVVTITASPVTPPTCTAPVADFTINNAQQCLTGNAFSFTNTSTGTTPSYTWNFGDGSTAVTTTDAAYSYASANTYTVTLVATNSCGSHQVTKTVTVTTVPATPASISGATSIVAGSTTTLSSATAGGVWSSSNTAVATIDANTGVVTAVAAGTTTISYTVSNSCGTTATSLSITVTAATPPVTPPTCTAPVANFTINNDTQCLSGNAFSFTNSSTGTAPSYTWSFGDGSTAVTTTNATYSYASSNTYTVTLVATNSCGSHQVTKTITVATVPAMPSGISGSTTITAGTTSNYSSATTGGVWSSSNTAVTTIDANTGVVTAVAAGTATISYTVSNSCGATATSLSITVTAVVPPVTPPVVPPCNLQASFSVNNLSQCVTGNQYIFTNTSTGGTAPFTYLWDLNDGTTATTANVNKTYAVYGDRDVTLKVTDANGCTSHASTIQIHVGAQPKAGFSVLTHTGNGQSTTFISSSTIAAGNMTYLWDLGNGQTSTLVNPTTTYTPGTYTVKLVVSGIGTCKDSSIQSITELAVASVKVYPNPVIDAIQVSFVSASATPTTFKLMDLAGRTLQVQTVTPTSRGVNVLATMNTRGLQSGSYVLYISDEQNGFLATKAILKQ